MSPNSEELVAINNSQLYSTTAFPLMAIQQSVSTIQAGEGKPKRRRKRNKDTSSLSSGSKRKLSSEQVRLLEINFANEHKLESERKDKIASELGLDPRQVAVWFQNRRVRWKSKRLEEEFSKMLAAHESTTVEKCRLESEVSTLRERLDEAEKEIRRLTEKIDWASNINSPSPSVLSAEAIGPPYFGQFGMDGNNDVFFAGESIYLNGMEWPCIWKN